MWERVPEGKWVISMGACATSGGVFNNYALVQSVNQVIPVDIYVPGCPPRPEQLIYAITLLQAKIMIERGTVKKALNLVPAGEQWSDGRLARPARLSISILPRFILAPTCPSRAGLWSRTPVKSFSSI